MRVLVVFLCAYFGNGLMRLFHSMFSTMSPEFCMLTLTWLVCMKLSLSGWKCNKPVSKRRLQNRSQDVELAALKSLSEWPGIKFLEICAFGWLLPGLDRHIASKQANQPKLLLQMLTVSCSELMMMSSS